MKLEGIAAFLAIVEAGSVSGAGRELNLSKSVVSERLTELERSLGAHLIQRTTRKLSITVQLSDATEYEGGELQFMVNQNIITAPKEKGTAIIFPSFCLHRVTPVIKGSRKSIVGWIAGPPYR